MGVSQVWLKCKTSSWGDAITREGLGSIKVWLSASAPPAWPRQASSNNRNLLQIRPVSHTRQDKQAIDESGVMHRLTGIDGAWPRAKYVQTGSDFNISGEEAHLFGARPDSLTAPGFNYHVWEVQIIHANGTAPNHYQHTYSVYSSRRLTGEDFIERH